MVSSRWPLIAASNEHKELLIGAQIIFNLRWIRLKGKLVNQIPAKVTDTMLTKKVKYAVETDALFKIRWEDHW